MLLNKTKVKVKKDPLEVGIKRVVKIANKINNKVWKIQMMMKMKKLIWKNYKICKNK